MLSSASESYAICEATERYCEQSEYIFFFKLNQALETLLMTCETLNNKNFEKTIIMCQYFGCGAVATRALWKSALFCALFVCDHLEYIQRKFKFLVSFFSLFIFSCV